MIASRRLAVDCCQRSLVRLAFLIIGPNAFIRAVFIEQQRDWQTNVDEVLIADLLTAKRTNQINLYAIRTSDLR